MEKEPFKYKVKIDLLRHIFYLSIVFILFLFVLTSLETILKLPELSSTSIIGLIVNLCFLLPSLYGLIKILPHIWQSRYRGFSYLSGEISVQEYKEKINSETFIPCEEYSSLAISENYLLLRRFWKGDLIIPLIEIKSFHLTSDFYKSSSGSNGFITKYSLVFLNDRNKKVEISIKNNEIGKIIRDFLERQTNIESLN